MLFLFKNKYEKKLTKEQRASAIQETLDSDYPVELVLLFASGKTAIASLLVVLQSILFYYRAPCYFYSQG
jgi:hypothetical protein